MQGIPDMTLVVKAAGDSFAEGIVYKNVVIGLFGNTELHKHNNPSEAYRCFNKH